MFRRCTVLQCAAIANALKLSAEKTNGFNIYKSKSDVIEVLNLYAKEDVGAKWIQENQVQLPFDAADSVCRLAVMKDVPSSGKELIARIETVGQEEMATLAEKKRFPIIVVEGLDGVGKTTVTSHLAKQLGGCLVRTPDPNLEHLRQHFRSLPEPISRGFYCATNYLAAVQILTEAQSCPVVVDRWWASTCAMSMAALYNHVDEIPAQNHSLWNWPSDLPKVDVGFVLDVPEDIRRKRMAKRGDENAEEKVLAAKEQMRVIAMESYRRMLPTYHPIQVPNYCYGINDMLDHCSNLEYFKETITAEKLLSAKFSEAQCKAAPCY